MKTEVRKEHGDWIVFVDDNPQFSFMYREEAEKVRNLVDVLVEAREAISSLSDYDLGEGNLTDANGQEQFYPIKFELLQNIDEALKDIGAI